jgi:hypothetical protein
MSGRDALEYLKDLCREWDDGTLARRFAKVAAATAIPLSLLVAGCVRELYGAEPAYGVPWDGGYEEEVCHDGSDNDSDGQVDCADPECADLEVCLGCFDEQDNDGDGAADCDDPSCAETEACLGPCDDGVDQDGDGRADCADPDCGGVAPCT